MKIECFNYKGIDDLFSNTYVVSDDFLNCIVVDPSCDYDGIIKYIEKNSLNLQGILLTHGHFDHIRGVTRLTEKFKVKTYITNNDKELLTDPELNCSNYGAYLRPIIVKANVNVVFDNDQLDLLNEPIRVIFTPYHTSGSVCYYLQTSKILLSGDTLFKKMIGRSDLPTSQPSLKRDSLNKIMVLPDDVKVYPGHGSSTTIGAERISNPFINR
ncbi:MAG: MBL fold metallo-hydrolase [Bacilli bacterium]|nr:MBL fold metallo-hydrolase [Bacilli bacterium]